jgi:hypothetical protein
MVAQPIEIGRVASAIAVVEDRGSHSSTQRSLTFNSTETAWNECRLLRDVGRYFRVAGILRTSSGSPLGVGDQVQDAENVGDILRED